MNKSSPFTGEDLGGGGMLDRIVLCGVGYIIYGQTECKLSKTIIMSVYQKEKYVSWDEVQILCRKLAARIHQDRPDLIRILAITRGGIFPAGILARELNIKLIETVGMESYNGMEQGGEVQILKEFNQRFSHNVLVVDDLADTGRTLKELKKSLVKPVVLTLFAKPEGLSMVDYYAEEVPQDTWVRFPWYTARAYVPPLVS